VRLPLRLPFRLPFSRRREEPGAERRGERQKPGMPVVARQVERPATYATGRFKTKPRMVFVGSGKGGAGKSFIASNLAYILAAHLPESVPVFAVDLDLDNYTLSKVVLPKDLRAKLIGRLVKEGRNYLNVADILDEGVVAGAVVLASPVSIFTCGGAQIAPRIRLIPAYHVLRETSQIARLKGLDALRLREGLNHLIDYLQGKNAVAILDGKQKSNLGINYDPLYKVATERADVVILVTEPPYLSFSSITAQYTDIYDKLVIVVNKMNLAFKGQFRILVSDAARHDVPVFVVPESKEDADVYSRELAPPATNLASKTALYVGALAMYLNLVERCDTKCCGKYEEILSKTLEVMRLHGRAGHV